MIDCKGKNCLESIGSNKYGYFVQPIILHWADRATEWPGKSDKVENQFIIQDAKTQKEIGKTNFTGKSKWLTLGGENPQDLLIEPTRKYVESFYK